MTTFHPGRVARLAATAAALFLATVSTTVFAQVTAFSAGAVEVRAFLPRTATEVYAAAYGGGIYRSTDAGATWTRLTTPANERYITSLAGNGVAIVAGSEEGLLRTGDGLTFVRTMHEPVSAVVMSPGATTTVLAAVKGVGVYRSTDSGQTFVLSNTGLTGLDIVALAEHPSNASIFYASAIPDGAGNRGGVFKSIDGGATWVATAAFENSPVDNQPAPAQAWSLTVDSAGNVHAAVFRPSNGGGRVYKLTGGVSAWDTAAANGNNTFGNVSVHRDSNTGTTIHTGARYLGILTSVAGGSYQYNAPNNGNAPSFFYTAVNAIGTMSGGSQVALMALKGAGIWRSTAAAIPRTWTRVETLLSADRVLSASQVPNSAASMLLGMHAGGVWRSDTAGNGAGTFFPPTINSVTRADFSYAAGATSVNAFTSIWQLSATSNAGNAVYAAAGNTGMPYGNDPPGLYRFNGTLWNGLGSASIGAPTNIVGETGMFLPWEPIYGVTVDPTNDNLVYATYLGGNFGIRRREGAPNWTLTPGAIPGVTPQVRGVVASAVGGRLMAMPFDDKPARSTDFGTNYTQVTINQTGFERLRFFQVAENPTNTNFWMGATNKGLFVSSDAGVNWTRSVAGFARQAFSAVGYKASGRAFAADRAGNRYCSPDNGVNWTTLAGGPLRAGVNAIKVMNGNLYYLTDGAGAFREDLSC